jgi:transcriptional regulator with XRE-family HTH domain
MSVFSTRLKELRNKANLSQQELSKIIGISKSSINMYERGEREPGLETVGALADYFDVQTDYLLGKHDDKRSLKDGKKYNRLMLQTVEEYRKLHEYTREQMELLLDWDNFYADMEEERILGDAGMLKVIQNTFLVNDSILADPKLQLPPEEPKLSEGEQLLLELFRKIPEDQQGLVLNLIRAALGNPQQ